MDRSVYFVVGEISRVDDIHLFVLPNRQKVFVSGDDAVRIAGDGCRENPIIVSVPTDGIVGPYHPGRLRPL